MSLHRSLVALVLLCAAHGAMAVTYTVNNANDSGSGSLRDQIALVNITPGTSHRIEFAPTMSKQIIELLQPLPVLTAAGVVIDASAAPGISIEPINPTNSFRLLPVGSSVQTLTLKGFAMRSGRAENSGDGGGCVDGANANGSATLTLDSMRFTSCIAVYAEYAKGGAVRWSGLSMTVLDSMFIGNAAITTGSGNLSAAFGGALSGRVVNIQGSRFEQNQASGRVALGGAVHADSSTLISDSVFLENLTDSPSGTSDLGGAVVADCAAQCLLRFERSFFGRNTAQSGAGLYLRTQAGALSVAQMDNLSFEGNIARGVFSTDVGGVLLQRTLLDARHLSFQGNSGVVANISAIDNSVVRELYNSVFGLGTGIGCFMVAFVQQAQANITVDNNCRNLIPGATLVPGLANGVVQINDPLPTIRFASQSPTVDSGSADFCLATDALGTTRPQDGNEDGSAACDIGAHERLSDALLRSGFEN